LHLWEKAKEMAKSVYKEKDGMEIELGMARRIKLWRTETELQTEADEGGPWEKLEVQTERNGAQMLLQTERTETSALLRAKRRTEI